MFWEKKFDQWLQGMRGSAALPLRLQLWNGQQFDLGSQAPEVTIRVPAPSALTYLLNPSLDNLGRAYVEGKLEVEGHLRAILEVAEQLAARGFVQGGRLGQLFTPRAHTRRQDQEAIAYHYDVSNDFYRAFLDPAMVYSCAYFETGAEDLATAQQQKIDHILTKLDVRPGHTLLDIGCGWGALVLRAAQAFGATCVGITLSEKQRELAAERVRAAGLEDRVRIRLLDYRDVEGRFDRITSVGMFEHVGLKNLPLYFSTMHRLLADDGLAMNHGICTTNTDHSTARYGAGEFIEQYVFPHGELPHIGTVLGAMQDGGLETLDLENLRRHYARTCALWAENFERNNALIRTLVDERTYRIWRVYLAGCAHAFRHDWISLFQVVCGKAGRDAGALRWSRRYMYS
ncbi:MAG: cyclopropane-fatty-acyl-phospholipid synthase family protein [Burkholderiaceae bacterium]|nr:cyclopropane-fatty-acyl-phospholipid synthase family protein [Burkholderiaceae bacterium]